MAQCSFCGTDIPAGTGLMYVKKDAKVLWFCSRKCEKNLVVLGRKPRNEPWTAEARAAKAAAITASQKGEHVKIKEPKEKKGKGSKAGSSAPEREESEDE
jgi:large subunit ribosomal protein L24e